MSVMFMVDLTEALLCISVLMGVVMLPALTTAYGAPSSPASYIDIYCCALHLLLPVDLLLIYLH
jgi:hypothetical protein